MKKPVRHGLCQPPYRCVFVTIKGVIMRKSAFFIFLAIATMGVVSNAAPDPPSYEMSYSRTVKVASPKRFVITWESTPALRDAMTFWGGSFVLSANGVRHEFYSMETLKVILSPGVYTIVLDAKFSVWEGVNPGPIPDITIKDMAGRTFNYNYDVEILSSRVRSDDPTVLDVVYVVHSDKPTVRVRILAFEDGERSFSKVVRPETLIEGTEDSVGDDIAPNVEHKISWRVSSDWTVKLAKVKVEVMSCLGELLPLETMTIPASDQYGKMKISWNAISYCQVFDALLWLYADKDPGLPLSDGVLMHDGNWIAGDIPNLSHDLQPHLSYEFQEIAQGVAGMTYILSKMGYTLLTGAPLTYANQETRLGLSPSGARQYGYKIVE